MEKIILQFATTEVAEDANLFTSIGIDWKLLLLQVIAFLILLAVLKKWVYPPLVAMLDKREAAIKASLESADEARRVAENAESEIATMLKDAKREAAEIVATAKTEASSLVDAAEQKSKKKAEALVAAAKTDIDNEVKAARTQLHNEMVGLVSLATEKVVGDTMTDAIDSKLIESALKGTQ